MTGEETGDVFVSEKKGDMLEYLLRVHDGRGDGDVFASERQGELASDLMAVGDCVVYIFRLSCGIISMYDEFREGELLKPRCDKKTMT